MRRQLRAIPAACAGLCVLSLATTAHAHAVGLSTGSYVAHGARVDVDLAVSRAELATSVPGVDRDGNGAIDDEELRAGRDAIGAAIEEGILVGGDGKPCTPVLQSVAPVAGDGVDVRLAYACPSAPSRLHVRFDLLDRLSPDHRHVAHLDLGDGAAVADEILHGSHRDVEVSAAGAQPRPAPRAGQWIWMGVEHILTGYDHLVFLFGLVLVGGRVRSLLGAVTAFTVAHSITLALAALDVWSPPPRLVEIGIAASIVWVGVENLFTIARGLDARGRWRLTFPFGLVHGFGFASALREVALPHAQVTLALVCFNSGVELGQLAVMAVVVPALLVARGRGWLGDPGARALSVGVAGAGLVWLVSRVLG